MKKHLVIPARLNSRRLPNKLLLPIHDKAMILWVIDRANAVKQAKIADDVWLATDSEQIATLCQDYADKKDINIIMTSPHHPSGTDRLAEVATINAWDGDDMVINMQGDEPLVPVALIEQVSKLLLTKPDCVMATLAERIDNFGDFINPSVVKVVRNYQQEALYFSRTAIPCHREFAYDDDLHPPPQNSLRHLGLYAYRVSLLQQFSHWQPSLLEKLECLEQLRILEHGGKIAVDIACSKLPVGVDTQADLNRLNAMDLSDFLS